MYKGTLENIRTRKQITQAFFVLLKSKNFSEITVSDIVKEAHVARVTYYRNFDSKEDILESYIDTVHDSIIDQSEYDDPSWVLSYDGLVKGFERTLNYFLADGPYILAIYHNGFGNLLLNVLNKHIEQAIGNMPSNSIDRYKLYFISGASFNLLIQWLEQGTIESPREIAEICAGYLCGDITKGIV